MNVLAVVLARGGSTRIPQKNLQMLGGLSLAGRAAQDAHRATLVNRVVVSTDDEVIAMQCTDQGAQWIQRPGDISGAHATIEQAVQHALQVCEARDGVQYDYVVALQAAVPVRPQGAIDALLQAVSSQHARGGVTAVRRSPWIWSFDESRLAQQWWNPSNGYPRSQDVRRSTLEEINSIQVTPRAEVLSGRRWGSPLVLLELPGWCDIDIDTEQDLQQARLQWPAVEAQLWQRAEYPAHLVRVPGYETRKLAAPLTPTMQVHNAIGIVLGNGPQIDALPLSFWRTIERWPFVSIGVNRIACSAACDAAGFAPDLHLVWDCPARGSEYTEAVRSGLARLEGRTWRLTSCEHDIDYYPLDQQLAKSDVQVGEPTACYLRHSSTDCAVNILYRLGLRTVYVFGVEMNDGAHCRTVPAFNDKPAACQHPNWLQSSLDAWRTVRDGLPGLRLYCGCETSKLVTEGVLPYRLPEGL